MTPRLSLKLTALVAAVLIGFILLLHAKPYDDPDMRAIFTPGACAMPCFMGIQPGVTLGDKAIFLLQNHDWIDPDSLYIAPDITRRYIWVTWRWSESKPDYLWGAGYMTYSPSGDGTVDFIQVHTTIPAGAIRLTLGPPQEDSSILTEHVSAYNASGILLQSIAPCSLPWQDTVNLTFIAPSRFDAIRSQLGLSMSADGKRGSLFCQTGS